MIERHDFGRRYLSDILDDIIEEQKYEDAIKNGLLEAYDNDEEEGLDD